MLKAALVLLAICTAVHAAAVPDRVARHAEQLERKLPAGFSLVIEPPFVVVGNEPRERVRQHAIQTVRWAVDRLKREYFEKDPTEVLEIWLFKDAESYERYSRELFRQTPETPYGYYASAHRALVMDIATGGGTLVHEIVHPFMEANFPACPAWFNEGLGSLYEQSRDVDGRIRGMVNWRLPALQRALRDGTAPSLERLLATDSAAFYGDDRGLHYAAARYLCYHLQERNLLPSFYREFRAAHRDDPTGAKTLQRLVQGDLPTFERNWRQFVLSLRYP